MSFSKRMGLVPTHKEIQMNSMDDELRVSLWNVLCLHVFEHVNPGSGYTTPLWADFKNDVVVNYFKGLINKAPQSYYILISELEKRYLNAGWNQAYDFIQFFIGKKYIKSNDFIDSLNFYLEKEYSGYRVINNMIVPISNEIEIDTINETLKAGIRFTGFDGVNIHLNKALEDISDRENPNYSNSIKECLSAVETASRTITGEGTLGNALNKLEKSGLEINNQLKESFNKIYNYTNDKNSGIRHAVIEGHKPPNFETAKYILITSSAFINYLIGLSHKINLL